MRQILKNNNELDQNNNKNGSVEIIFEERLTAKNNKYVIDSHKLSSVFLLKTFERLKSTIEVKKWARSEGSFNMKIELPNMEVNKPIVHATKGGFE